VLNEVMSINKRVNGLEDRVSILRDLARPVERSIAGNGDKGKAAASRGPASVAGSGGITS
jgi:hypothetical protein